MRQRTAAAVAEFAQRRGRAFSVSISAVMERGIRLFRQGGFDDQPAGDCEPVKLLIVSLCLFHYRRVLIEVALQRLHGGKQLHSCNSQLMLQSLCRKFVK